MKLGPRVRGYLAPSLTDAAAWGGMLDAPLATLACDEAGTLVFMNGAMIDLIGGPLDPLLGTGWMSILSQGETARADLDEVLASRGALRHRREIAVEGGAKRSLELTCSAIRLPDEKRGMMMIAVEVPGARAESPAPNLRGYRELVEDAPDLLARFSVRGKLLYINRAAERFTGYTPEQMIADGNDIFGKILHPEAQAIWLAAMAQVTRGDARTFDAQVVHKDGRQQILSVSLYPIRDARGQVRVIEGTARDITAIRQLEAMRARNEERASLDRLKSQLLANVSHELRTPLVSIKGYNELLLRGALGPLTPRQKRGLEIAGANTERLIELIESLLDFARREEERLELHSERFDVRLAVEDAVRALAERISSRRLVLSVELGAQQLYVHGDRARLAQVFRALVGNAEKFSDPRDGEPKEIVVSAVGDRQFVEVSVTDRGIGIPKEAHAKIFDRFYQVDASSTRRFGGAGLGLALAKELVTLHGGEIRVDSVEGRGSTFTVRLPTARADSGKLEQLVVRPLVLIGVEEATLEALRPELESGLGSALRESDVIWAHSEADVVRRARRHRPDLVLLAFRDGEPTVAQLKRDAETSNVPIIVVTAAGRRPVGRADLVAERGDTGRLIAGLQRLLGRATVPPASKVIVVEDEIEILDFTRFVLEREGYQVECISTGREALEQVGSDCGLVILDIALEDSDGIQVCKTLKGAPATREVPVLIMTAMSGDEVRQVSLAAGADGYLVKPFGVDEFLRQVRLHVRSRNAIDRPVGRA